MSVSTSAVQKYGFSRPNSTAESGTVVNSVRVRNSVASLIPANRQQATAAHTESIRCQVPNASVAVGLRVQTPSDQSADCPLCPRPRHPHVNTYVSVRTPNLVAKNASSCFAACCAKPAASVDLPPGRFCSRSSCRRPAAIWHRLADLAFRGTLLLHRNSRVAPARDRRGFQTRTRFAAGVAGV